MRQFILLLLCPLWLVGCATSQPAAPVVPQNPPPAINASRVEVLSNIENWDLNALIAIRNTAKVRGDSASMNWQQTHKNYIISLFGPLGSHAVKLSGSPGHVTLENEQGKKSFAPTAEAMLQQQTGWRLPVSYLFYWVRGLPVPDVMAKKEYDADQRLQVMIQQGWRIQYLSYTKVNNIDLPSKIFLNNPELNIKIVISKWQI